MASKPKKTWWERQYIADPYKLEAPYNTCSTRNQLSKIECFLALIAAICFVFFYLANSNFDLFGSIVQGWLLGSMLISIIYLMRTDTTSRLARIKFSKNSNKWLTCKALLLLVVVSLGLAFTAVNKELVGLILVALGVGVGAGWLGLARLNTFLACLILFPVACAMLYVYGILVGGDTIDFLNTSVLAGVGMILTLPFILVLLAIVEIATGQVKYGSRTLINMIPSIWLKFRILLYDLRINKLNTLTDGRIKKNALIYLRMNLRYKPELLPQLESSSSPYRYYTVKAEYFFSAWLLMSPAHIYRWIIKVNCLPLYFILWLREYGYSKDGVKKNNKITSSTTDKFFAISLA